ncbi:conserved hypothetical protein [Theileria equi strain WA]|uniref:Uncharacterized protein n=1 Tax=Theileria equi strain WA TaxID=1537102 RepID=L1LGS5_THEEQ|nr:conserved hypothetical protein [Theileria equi strain WA]EKX74318.1 conserved hypothetical protein [Theileria equi strain WA]|eukprot:XP_004833770.1 conserved hypothetical protein [Theileria equi strain WA]
MLADNIEMTGVNQDETKIEYNEDSSDVLDPVNDNNLDDTEAISTPEDRLHTGTTHSGLIEDNGGISNMQDRSTFRDLNDDGPSHNSVTNSAEHYPVDGGNFADYKQAEDQSTITPTGIDGKNDDHIEDTRATESLHQESTDISMVDKTSQHFPNSLNTECRPSNIPGSTNAKELHDNYNNADETSDTSIVNRLSLENPGEVPVQHVKQAEGKISLAEEMMANLTLISNKNVNEVREHRFKRLEKRGHWTPMKGLVNKIDNYGDLNSSDLTWGPFYEIPSKPGRKGPALDIFSDSLKHNDQYCVVLQTPDSIERYSLNGKLLQHVSCSPYAITKVSCGNVVGMGRVVICGTQCGKVIFYSFFRFEQLLILDTTTIYEDYLSIGDSMSDDSEKQDDHRHALNSTLFEINCLALVNCLEEYSKWLAIGNQLGHLLIYEIPSLNLLNFICHPPDENCISRSSSESSFYDHDNEEKSPSYGELQSKIMKSKSEKNVYISCIRLCSVYNDLWVGYGDGSFAVFEMITGLCKKFVPNNNNDSKMETITSIHFSYIYNITLIVYGNDKVDIWDYSTLTFVKTFPSSILTCGTSPISSLCIYEMSEKALNNICLLFIGSMDGSLILRRIDRLQNGDIAWTLLFNFSYTGSEFDETKNRNKLSHGGKAKFSCIDFREAPITCLYPLLSHNLILVGNACGGLVSVCNLFKKA